MARDDFHIALRGSGIPASSRWDVLDAVSAMAKEQFRGHARGAYLVKADARTSGGRSYYRKNVAELRSAMDSDIVTPRSASVTMNMTLGYSSIPLVVVRMEFDELPISVLSISIVGRDRGKTETFGGQLLRAISENSIIRTGAPTADVSLLPVTISSRDSGSGEIGVGAMGWLAALGFTVVGGVLTQVAIKLLRLD